METGDVLGGSVADASVRLAAATDADAMGAVQARAWRAAYAGMLPPEALDTLTGPALAGPWREAVVRPPTTRHAVFVACSGSTVVGFVALAPSGDPDLGPQVGELAALVVDPAHQRRGHGSRLLSAAVARLRDLGSAGLATWVPDGDTARQAFLTSAGMVADGARRSYAVDADAAADTDAVVDAADADAGRTLTEIRLTAALEA